MRTRQQFTAALRGCAAMRTCAASAWLAAMPAAAQPAPGIAPLNYFLHAAGPAAAPTMHLGWMLTALAVAVSLLVATLLLVAIARRRPRADPAAVHPDSGGVAWIYIGTGVSSIVLLATLVYVLMTLETVAAPARQPNLTITVTAYDWWWKVTYSDSPDPARNFATANEIHIPVGEPVKIELQSADVIHAFWVPQLAGKTQTIPGQINEQWIEADRPGTYRGQCSQFCGAQHAHMAFEVVAQNAQDFDAWRLAQGQAAQPVSGATAAAGQKLFGERCAGCHTVRGTDALGVQAPDLTHLGSRRLLAAGALANTSANQLDWIQHAQRIKPDSLMPSIALSAADAAALSAYLSTLH
ncbi:cytochrome c oxidase subunit II [Paraburkholderia gardini]|uniref:cytochrome-c oxidase n=1 Tax=Paraburkholderia gardini TaxID=2823469 RepID=A0ABM8U961_9BURK|nr:cytochrome c oxidase subunit II [Paraburkholderia gardini]CAG4918245.1 Cytochrome c oxidase subunit 2 [Paraburkholderia gardini]